MIRRVVYPHVSHNRYALILTYAAVYTGFMRRRELIYTSSLFLSYNTRVNARLMPNFVKLCHTKLKLTVWCIMVTVSCFLWTETVILSTAIVKKLKEIRPTQKSGSQLKNVKASVGWINIIHTTYTIKDVRESINWIPNSYKRKLISSWSNVYLRKTQTHRDTHTIIQIHTLRDTQTH